MKKLGYAILAGEDFVSHISLSIEERSILIATLGIEKLVKYGVGKIVGKGAKEASKEINTFDKSVTKSDNVKYYRVQSPDVTGSREEFKVNDDGTLTWL